MASGSTIKHEQGRRSPSNLDRPYGSTYRHVPSGILYRQNAWPNGSGWEEVGSGGSETDPIFTAHPAFNVINSGTGTLFLADDGTYKTVGGAQNLASVLATGNITGANDIVMTTGQALVADSGGSTLNLRPFGADNELVLATDGLAYGEVGVEMYANYMGLWGAAYAQFLAFNNGGTKHIELRNSIAGEGVELGAGATGGIDQGDLIIYDNSLAAKTSANEDKFPTIISARNGTVNLGVVNSTLLGGNAGTIVKTSNSAYVQQLVHNNGNAFETKLNFQVPLSDEFITVPYKVGGGTLALTSDIAAIEESFVVAVSDETTDLTTGTAKLTFRMPYGFTLNDIRASVTTAPTGSVITVDVNEAGASILSTKLTIDATEKTSVTAATPPVISDADLADDAEITVDIDTVGSTIAGTGLKVTFIGTKSVT